MKKTQAVSSPPPAARLCDGFTVTGVSTEVGRNQEVRRPCEKARHHSVPQHLQQSEGASERCVEMGRRGKKRALLFLPTRKQFAENKCRLRLPADVSAMVVVHDAILSFFKIFTFVFQPWCFYYHCREEKKTFSSCKSATLNIVWIFACTHVAVTDICSSVQHV